MLKLIFFQPPRIGGVKVYDKNVSRTEIIMDVDLLYVKTYFSITKFYLFNFYFVVMQETVILALLCLVLKLVLKIYR